MKNKLNETDEKRCNNCNWEFYSTYGTGKCPECGSNDWEYILKGYTKNE